MCKRSDPSDALVRRMLKLYNVNLLPLPRRSAEPGELYIQTGRKVKATSGSINAVIEPEVDLPEPYVEPLPDLTGVATEAVGADLGLSLLGNFLTAIGVPPGVVDEVKVGYRRSSTAHVKFQFEQVTRSSLDPFTIGTALIGHHFKAHPWIRDGNRYYAAAGFLRSSSISIVAQDSSSRTVELGAGVMTVLDATAEVTAEQGGDGTMAYRGADPLAIAVELYKLEYDDEDGFRMGSQGKPVALMRGRDAPPEPDFPAEDDEALLYVESQGR